jgi:GNAT superfamily N-acetyltransferase
MEQAEDDIDDLVVDFTVRLSELNESPAEALAHEINGTIYLVDPDAGEQVFPIGHVTACLFNIVALRDAGSFMLDPYDMRSHHLSETYARIYDLDGDDFDYRVLKKAEFDDPLLVQWHLHASGLYLRPEFRGRRRGVRALKLLKELAQRPSLLVTARAFPEEPDQRAAKPNAKDIAALARYYLREKALGFQQIGRLDQGWLVANWST